MVSIYWVYVDSMNCCGLYRKWLLIWEIMNKEGFVKIFM